MPKTDVRRVRWLKQQHVISGRRKLSNALSRALRLDTLSLAAPQRLHELVNHSDPTASHAHRCSCGFTGRPFFVATHHQDNLGHTSISSSRWRCALYVWQDVKVDIHGFEALQPFIQGEAS